MYFLYILGHLRTTATVALLDFAFLYSNSNQIRENTFHTRSMKTEPRPRERVHSTYSSVPGPSKGIDKVDRYWNSVSVQRYQYSKYCKVL